MAQKRAKSPKRRKPRHVNPTPKRVKFVSLVLDGHTLTKAAEIAGYSPKNPGQSGHQALAQIRKTAPEMLERHGLTFDYLIENYLRPHLDARKTELFPFTKNGVRQVLAVEVKDHRTSQIALDQTWKLMGVYTQEAENKAPAFSVIILNANNRPNWSQMKRAQAPPIEPGEPAT